MSTGSFSIPRIPQKTLLVSCPTQNKTLDFFLQKSPARLLQVKATISPHYSTNTWLVPPSQPKINNSSQYCVSAFICQTMLPSSLKLIHHMNSMRNLTALEPEIKQITFLLVKSKQGQSIASIFTPEFYLRFSLNLKISSSISQRSNHLIPPSTLFHFSEGPASF